MRLVGARVRASSRSRVTPLISFIDLIDLIHSMRSLSPVTMRPRVVVRASPSSPSPSPSTTTTTTRGGVSIRFEPCRREDLARVTTMERASYPADEAASAVSLEMRQREAGEFFMVARAVDSMDWSGLEGARASDASGTAAAERAALDADARSIVGYVCGTLASGDVLDESTMSSHDPTGDVLAIHSVCVDERFRRRGVAASALAHYVARWIVHDDTQHENDDDTTTTTTTKVRRVRLLCKENLIPFYERYGGFALEGASAVEHGAETWFDMVLDLA